MSQTVEIIVAHYNGSKYIGDQLDSIQKNFLPDGFQIQITVIDDYSRNEEFEKLLVTCSRWPNVKTVRNEHNLGVIKTFERGLKESRAPYVMLCDQDDIWLPEKIALTLEKMRANEAGQPAMVFTEVRTVNDNLETITERMIGAQNFDQAKEKHTLLYRNIIPGCTMMMNRKLIEFALPFPATIPMHDHWLAICAAFTGTLSFVDRPTMLYRQHQSNAVGQPNRSLIARLSRPLQTFRQFQKGMQQKGLQAIELANRLPHNSDRAFAGEVGHAFLHRSIGKLHFLIRSGTFDANWIALPLICILYLTAGQKKFEA